MNIPQTVARLLNKGVIIPNPFSVDIGEDVVPERISANGVVLYPGTRLSGEKTLIMAGVKLGAEAPVSLDNCRLGNNVELKGGYFTDSVFLDGVSIASGAQVRENCLLEEDVKAGHTVGLKQSILFPFVTLGSLINFCDVFMAGGTSRKNHSEVGSSYIHFNYTPNQDKATASLLGDVPRGVMLRESPIFLGGQGGLVGPARIGFGTVIAAGEVWRGDCPEGGRLLSGEKKTLSEQPFYPGLYVDIKKRVLNNILYYANLLALRQWYVHVRSLFSERTMQGGFLDEGAREVIRGAAFERIYRFRILAEKMDRSIELAKSFLPESLHAKVILREAEFRDRWGDLEESLTSRREEKVGEKKRDEFTAALVDTGMGTAKDYLRTIASLDQGAVALGSGWMQEVVGDVFKRALSTLPSFGDL
jgi:UDP-N-acetylglucosamine/UDP-N-acetylgalactosamine diphosphorylase